MIKRIGFAATSIWMGKEEELVRSGKQLSMVKIAREEGLFIENVHAPYDNCNDVWSDNNSFREGIIAEYGRCLELSARNNIPAVVLHVTKGADVPRANKNGLFAFEKLLQVAKELRVKVAIENTHHNGHVDYILENINSKYIGLCYDSSHDYLWGNKPSAILNKWRHRLCATHFSDTNGNSDCHWLPQKGVIDWNIIKQAFPANYTGSIGLEVLPQNKEIEPEVQFLRQAIESGKWLRNLLGINEK